MINHVGEISAHILSPKENFKAKEDRLRIYYSLEAWCYERGLGKKTIKAKSPTLGELASCGTVWDIIAIALISALDIMLVDFKKYSSLQKQPFEQIAILKIEHTEWKEKVKNVFSEVLHELEVEDGKVSEIYSPFAHIISDALIKSFNNFMGSRCFQEFLTILMAEKVECDSRFRIIIPPLLRQP